MKHALVYFCLFAVSSVMATIPFGIQNKISAKTREVAIRSFRLPKDLTVSPKDFKEIVEDQLCDRYYVYQEGDQVELVEVSAWNGTIGVPHLKRRVTRGVCPFPHQLKSLSLFRIRSIRPRI